MSSRFTEQWTEGNETRLPVYRNGIIVTHAIVDENDYKWAQHLTFVLDDDDDVRLSISNGPRLCELVLTNASSDIGRLGADSMDCVLRQEMQDVGYAVTADANQIAATDEDTGETFVVRYWAVQSQLRSL